MISFVDSGQVDQFRRVISSGISSEQVDQFRGVISFVDWGQVDQFRGVISSGISSEQVDQSRVISSARSFVSRLISRLMFPAKISSALVNVTVILYSPPMSLFLVERLYKDDFQKKVRVD